MIPFGRAGIVYLHDLVVCAVAVVLAFYLRVGADAFDFYGPLLVTAVPVAIVVGAVTFMVFGLYRGIWRYASVPDMVQLIKAVAVSVVAFGAVMFQLAAAGQFDAPLPRSVPLIYGFVLVALLAGPRFGYRLWKDRRRPQDVGMAGIPVLLIGVGDAAALFLNSLRRAAYAPYRVVGVLEEKSGGHRVGREIHGVPVMGGIDQLESVVALLSTRGERPQRLVLTRGNEAMAPEQVRSLLDRAEALGLGLARLPSLTDFKAAQGDDRIELRPIAIEDLLGRPQAVLDRSAIAGLVAGRRVLITGAGGTIGSELSRQIAALNPAALVLVENGEFNLYTIDMELRERHPALDLKAVLTCVRDRTRIIRLFETLRPELVFHAAALKHVPLVEGCPEEGVLTNAIGTRNVADAARAVGVRAMVLISTDKAVVPSSVMGTTKRVAEAYCQALDTLPGPGAGPGSDVQPPTRFVTVRFGNVLGSSGSVVPLFQRQLARGGPITVTHPEMRRYFMTVREAVELVLQASAHGVSHPDQRGRILVLDMGEPVRIVDLARQMIRLSGHRPDVDIRIEFVGQRPGEKLFEEILYAAEQPTRTEADGVFIASPRLIDHGALSQVLDQLEAAARAGDRDTVAALLQAVVPEYRTPA